MVAEDPILVRVTVDAPFRYISYKIVIIFSLMKILDVSLRFSFSFFFFLSFASFQKKSKRFRGIVYPNVKVRL